MLPQSLEENVLFSISWIELDDSEVNLTRTSFLPMA